MRRARTAALIPSLILFLIVCHYPEVGASSVKVTGPAFPQSITPRAIATFPFTVTNNSSTEMALELSLTYPEEWTVLAFQKTVDLSPGESETLLVSFLIPSAAEPGEYQLLLEAASTTDPSVEAKASVEVKIEPVAQLGLSGPKKGYGQPGEAVEYELRVTNQGNGQDVVKLSAGSTGGWSAKISQDKLSLPPGKSRTVTVRHMVPEGARPEEKGYLRITARSTLDKEVTEELTILTDVLPSPPEEVEGSFFPVVPGKVKAEISIDDRDISSSLDLSMGGSISEKQFIWTDLSLGMDLKEGIWESRSGQITYRDQTQRVTLGTPSLGGAFQSIGGQGVKYSLSDSYRFSFIQAEKGKGFKGRADWEGGHLGVAKLSKGGTTFTSLSFDTGVGPAEVSAKVGTGTAGDKEGSVTSLSFSPYMSGPVSLSVSYLDASPNYPGSPSNQWKASAYSGFSFPDLSLGVSFRRLHDKNTGENLDKFELDSAFPLEEGLELTFHYTREDEAGDGARDKMVAGFSQDLAPMDYSVKGIYVDPESGKASTRIVGDVTLDLSGNLRLSPKLSVGNSGSTLTLGARYRGSHFDWHPKMVLEEGNPSSMSLGVQRGGTSLQLSKEGKTFGLSFTSNFEGPLMLVKTKGRIVGKVFVDENGDGEYNPGERGIPGLLLTADGFQAQAITGDKGQFRFLPSPSGDYKLRVTNLPQKYALMGPMPIPVHLAADEVKRVNIPVQESATLKGRVALFRSTSNEKSYLEGNGNNNHATNSETKGDKKWVLDRGLSGTRLVLRDGYKVHRTTTGPRGYFSFPSVKPGTWTLQVYGDNLPSHYELERDTFSIQLEPGETKQLLARALPVRRKIEFIGNGEVEEDGG